MISDFKNTLARHYINMRGWRTNRKLVVIESDDWGSIRMPNQEVKQKYIAKGYDLSLEPYNQLDTLANSEDLESLYAVLRNHRDSRGNHPIITFNTVLANPDFDKIKASGFREYHYKVFTETLKCYYPDEDVFALWKQGINEGLIQPQFHGREHVNAPLWLDLLQGGNKALLDAFELGFWGIPEHLYPSKHNHLQASWNSAMPEHIEGFKIAVKEGLDLFEKTFEFKSRTFIANNFIWPIELNEVLAENGVQGLQGMHYQILPDKDKGIKLHEVYIGKRSEQGQIYTIRNCRFELHDYSKDYNLINTTLREIRTAFMWKKPAIISIHRLNFIGSLNKENRDRTLKKYNVLLGEIIKRYPEVEFISSDKLIELILRDNER